MTSHPITRQSAATVRVTCRMSTRITLTLALALAISLGACVDDTSGVITARCPSPDAPDVPVTTPDGTCVAEAIESDMYHPPVEGCTIDAPWPIGAGGNLVQDGCVLEAERWRAEERDRRLIWWCGEQRYIVDVDYDDVDESGAVVGRVVLTDYRTDEPTDGCESWYTLLLHRVSADGGV